MKLRDSVVTLAHGAGGKATRALVEGLFLEEFSSPLLEHLFRKSSRSHLNLPFIVMLTTAEP